MNEQEKQEKFNKLIVAAESYIVKNAKVVLNAIRNTNADNCYDLIYKKYQPMYDINKLREKEENIKKLDLLRRFCIQLQNYQAMPKAINYFSYNSENDSLKSMMLQDNEIFKIAEELYKSNETDALSIYKKIKAKLKFEEEKDAEDKKSFFNDRVKISEDNKPFKKVIVNNKGKCKIYYYYNWAWLKYCVGLSDVFKFLNDNERVNKIFEDKPKSNIFDDIFGLGNALTSDFLKEIGHIKLIKPDVHIIEIYNYLTESSMTLTESSMTSKSKDSKQVQNKFSEWIQKLDNERYTPYYIDKILWLCCTGDFYEDGIIITKMTRQNFLNYFDNYLNNNK